MFQLPSKGPSGTGFSAASHAEDMARLKQRADTANAGTPSFPEFACKVGETTRFVILDNEEDVFFGFEHATKGQPSGRQQFGDDVFTSCLNHGNESGPCLVCADGKIPFKSMHLSGLQRPTPSEKDRALKANRELKAFYRRHMRVKSSAFSDEIQTALDVLKAEPVRAMQMDKRGRHEIRGTIIEVTRPNPKSAKSGVWRVVGCFTDEELLKHFGHDAIVKDDGTVVAAANEFITPFDYDEMFATPDSHDQAAVMAYAQKTARLHGIQVAVAYKPPVVDIIPDYAPEFGEAFGQSTPETAVVEEVAPDPVAEEPPADPLDPFHEPEVQASAPEPEVITPEPVVEVIVPAQEPKKAPPKVDFAISFEDLHTLDPVPTKPTTASDIETQGDGIDF